MEDSNPIDMFPPSSTPKPHPEYDEEEQFNIVSDSEKHILFQQVEELYGCLDEACKTNKEMRKSTQRTSGAMKRVYRKLLDIMTEQEISSTHLVDVLTMRSRNSAAHSNDRLVYTKGLQGGGALPVYKMSALVMSEEECAEAIKLLGLPVSKRKDTRSVFLQYMGISADEADS